MQAAPTSQPRRDASPVASSISSSGRLDSAPSSLMEAALRRFDVRRRIARRRTVESGRTNPPRCVGEPSQLDSAIAVASIGFGRRVARRKPIEPDRREEAGDPANPAVSRGRRRRHGATRRSAEFLADFWNPRPGRADPTPDGPRPVCRRESGRRPADSRRGRGARLH